jgi:hypothetical protein
MAVPLRLGVAMCSYNGEAYIGQQIASILAQTRPVDCIVVSDDGSTDDTPGRVEAALRAGPVPWRFLGDGRLGITQNFARAVAACDADVILLCDQDDVWQPHKVERMARVFEEDPSALLAFSDARLVDAALQDLGRSQFQMVRMTDRLHHALEGPRAFETLLRRNVVTGATVAFRRSLLDAALPFMDGWLHDEWLAILAAVQGGLRCVAEPLVLYRQHWRNQCGMRPEGLARQLRQAAQQGAAPTGVMRLQVLQHRLNQTASHGTPAQFKCLGASLQFAQWQVALPRIRPLRAMPIAAKLMLGAYQRYSGGLRCAVKDLLAARN